MAISGVSSIRSSILGGDRGFKVIEGGGGGSGGGQETHGGDDHCPVTPLGHMDGVVWFLDVAGQPRKYAADKLGNRNNILLLFGGDETWLRDKHPYFKQKRGPDGKLLFKPDGNPDLEVIDFSAKAASQDLIQRAFKRGMWGKSVSLRQPGIWRGEDGMPVVHCGDKVLIGNEWHDPGIRTGKQIWTAAEAVARPASPCDVAIARQLRDDLQNAWNYKNPAAGIIIMGLLYSGWVCGALNWRMSGFVTGPSGSGKSALMKTYRAAWALHDYSNDTSKPGMEQTLGGQAIPAIIDEANDRNQSAGRDLLDIVLSASGDDGTKLKRGTSDGKGRVSEIVSSVMMFSIYPPPLQPQHLGRFVLIELEKPDSGADHKDWHRNIVAFARKHATALWGRAISAFERYEESLGMFRAALGLAGCSAREMDSKGALLAGWYVMENDGLPDDKAIREGIAALGGFLTTADQAEEDDAPQRALQYLLASHIQLNRSTDREPIGETLEIAFGHGDEARQPAAAIDILGRYGVRVVRACASKSPPPLDKDCQCVNCYDNRFRKQVPRLQAPIPIEVGRAAGIWLANRHPSLDAIFKGSDFDDRKWQTALSRCQGVRPSGKSIRVGSASGHAIWLPLSLILPDD